MFGHLKAEDFVSLLEGVEPSLKYKSHIEACAQCRTTWDSMRVVHAEIASQETDIPEPDWLEFRSSVRDGLLSRSIQRQSSVRRWTGWAMPPAAVWALSLLLVVLLTTATVFWKIEPRTSDRTPDAAIEAQPVEPVVEFMDAGPERSLFDDVVSLGEEQQERFRQMLESAQQGAANQQ